MGELVKGEEAIRMRPPTGRAYATLLGRSPTLFSLARSSILGDGHMPIFKMPRAGARPSGGGVLVVSVTGGGCDPARRRVFWPPCVWLALVTAEGMSAPRSKK